MGSAHGYMAKRPDGARPEMRHSSRHKGPTPIPHTPGPGQIPSNLRALQRTAGNHAVAQLLGDREDHGPRGRPGSTSGGEVARPRLGLAAGGAPAVQRSCGTITADATPLERLQCAQSIVNDTMWDYAEGWPPVEAQGAEQSQQMVTGIGAGLERILRWAMEEEEQSLIRSLASDRSMTLVGPTLGRVVGQVVPGVHGKIAAFGMGVLIGNAFHDQRAQLLDDTAHATRFLSDLQIEASGRAMELVSLYGRSVSELGARRAELRAMFEGDNARVRRLRRDLDLYERDVRGGRHISSDIVAARSGDAAQLRADFLSSVRRFSSTVGDMRRTNSRMPAATEGALQTLRERYAEHLATSTGTQQLRARRLVGLGRGAHLRGTLDWSPGGRWGQFRIRAVPTKMGGVDIGRLSPETQSLLNAKTPVELSTMGTGNAQVKWWLRDATHTLSEVDSPMITWSGGQASVPSIYQTALARRTVQGFLAAWRGPSKEHVAATIVALIENVPLRELALQGRRHQWG